ncbi:MAG: hypothetical protein ANABAC_1591 [Anaerolineae bacterium]|nr:MAG: hypothetical protein ANABAC_1591 [Anaerolineae bacterium]
MLLAAFSVFMPCGAAEDFDLFARGNRSPAGTQIERIFHDLYGEDL